MAGNNFSVFLGVCVEDRQLKSRLLKCQSIELTPMMLGDLGDHTDFETFKFEDVLSNSEVSGRVKASNVVVADWFGLTSNRTYPPDIVKGEQVLLFRYMDTDKFYWISMGREDNLRRGELLRFAVSDDMSVVKKLNDDNSYFIELDTKVTKRIRIVTSKSDGESYRYNLIFDAIKNTVELGDDDGNKFEIFSNEPRVRMVNKSGTLVDLNKENLILLAPDEMLLRSANKLTLTSNEVMIVTQNFNVSSDSFSLVGTSGSACASNITGALNIEGTMSMNGPLSVTGDVLVSGNVTANNIT